MNRSDFMKKVLIIVSLILVICLILLSCNSADDADTSNDPKSYVNSNADGLNDSHADMGSNTDISVDAETSNNTNTSDNTDENLDDTKPNLPYEKYGNKVYFTSEKKATNYYVNVIEKQENDNLLDEEIKTNYDKVFVPPEIPADEKSYVMFIQSYEELLNYFVSPNVDETIFEKNYVICIREIFPFENEWKEYFNTLGYYNFEFKDGKYEISVDRYYSVVGIDFVQEYITVPRVLFLAIPKTHLDFAEGVHEIVVNEHLINNKHNGISGPQIGEPTPSATNTHWYVENNSQVSLPENPTAWVVKKNSSLEKQLGLEENSYSNQDYRVILYLPNEPKYDFIITEKVIENGDLYLTVEEYPQYTNWYLNKNNVNFYDLYIKDSSELSESFDVYILVRTVENESTEKWDSLQGVGKEASVDGKGNEEDLNKQDILDTLIPNDEDFPFDNIVVERSGYDIVAAGKYYGNDFDNIKYYGSYYRIIDNYEDFSELTQWGNQVDKSVFDSNVILVLHSYRSHYVYNSIRSEKGIFIELKEEKGSKKLSLTEMWIISDRAEIGKEDTIGSRTKAKSAFLYPIDVKETQYLLIPKEDLPSNLPVNGELELKSQTIVLE